MNAEKKFLDAYDKYADSVFRLCYFKTSDRATALDLTQDTFTRTWTYIQAGKGIDNYKTFVFQVARNLIKDYYKKSKSIPFHSFKEGVIENQLVDAESATTLAETNLVKEIINNLSDSDRELLQLRLIEEYSVEEISKILGVNPNTISVRIYRAVKRVRKKYYALDKSAKPPTQPNNTNSIGYESNLGLNGDTA